MSMGRVVRFTINIGPFDIFLFPLVVEDLDSLTNKVLEGGLYISKVFTLLEISFFLS